MRGTYTAVEVSAPGKLRVVERPVSELEPGQVRIRVEACGICHTDAATVTGGYSRLTLPRVPGHEVVSRIEALGAGVSRWKIGQRVGVGLLAGEDGVCESCRRGDMVNCQNAVVSGVTRRRRICGSQRSVLLPAKDWNTVGARDESGNEKGVKTWKRKRTW